MLLLLILIVNLYSFLGYAHYPYTTNNGAMNSAVLTRLRSQV